MADEETLFSEEKDSEIFPADDETKNGHEQIGEEEEKVDATSYCLGKMVPFHTILNFLTSAFNLLQLIVSIVVVYRLSISSKMNTVSPGI